MWELRYSDECYVVRIKLRKRQPLPDWYLDEPTVLQIEKFYLASFWKLVTERRGGQVIPYSCIVEFAERSGLDSDMIDPFCAVMWTLDRALNGWHKDKAASSSIVDKPSPAQRAKAK